MLARANTALLIVGSIIGLFFSARSAEATQATTSDLTDHIVQLGGWFNDAGSDPTYHYWAQVSYTLQSTASGSKASTPGASSTTPAASSTTPGANSTSPGAGPTSPGPSSGASGSNITTLIMTKTMLQAELATGGISTPPSGGAPTIGPPCANGMTVMETVTLDLRELQAASTPIQSPETIDEGRAANNPTFNVWTVKLTVNGGKKLIRVNTVTSPPTCKNAGVPVALPNGKSVLSTTSQKDVSAYPIVFADLDQAKYLQMLVSSLVPTLNPPRLNVAPLP